MEGKYHWMITLDGPCHLCFDTGTFRFKRVDIPAGESLRGYAYFVYHLGNGERIAIIPVRPEQQPQGDDRGRA